MTVVENNYTSSVSPFAENLASPTMSMPSSHGSPSWSELPEICKLPNVTGTESNVTGTESKMSVFCHPQKDEDDDKTEYNEAERRRGKVKKIKTHKLPCLKRTSLLHIRNQLLSRCVKRCKKMVEKLVNEDEKVKLSGKQLYRNLVSSEKKTSAFILLTLESKSREEGTQQIVNRKRGTLIHFKKPILDFLKGNFLEGLDWQLMKYVKKLFVELIVKVLNWEEKKLLYLEVATVLENNHADALEAEWSGGMMQQDSLCEPQIPESNTTNFVGLESIGNSSKNNNTIWWQKQVVDKTLIALQAECRGGMMQQDSTCEAETNYVVGLKSIDAIGESSSKNNTVTICRWQKDHGITREVLEQLFGMSRDAAAKTINVSISTFKRACRDFGITRWPNHKRQMLNSSLNQQENVQAVKKHKGSGSQQCPEHQGNNAAMSVKVTYKNDTIRFPLSSSSTIKYLEEQLETKLKISLENLSIKYQDEEDEWITLTCDSELMHGMDVLRSFGKTVIRMMLTPKFE